MPVKKTSRRPSGSSRADRARPLPDYVGPGLKLLFVGINPGLVSAAAGHYYANPRNAFWRLLHEAGLTPAPLSPAQGRALLDFGYGLTDIVKRPSRGAADLKRREFSAGRARLSRLVERYRPGAVCFNGKAAFEGYFGRAASASFGSQRLTLAGRPVFVVPSTSPANAVVPWAVKRRYFRELKAWIMGLASTDGQERRARSRITARTRPVNIAIAFHAARAKDLPTLLSLYAQLDDDDRDLPTLTKAERLLRRIRRYPDYKIYLASVRGDTVGTFALAILDNLAHRGRPSAVIENVVVDRRRREQGIGRAMMRFAIKRCRERGCYKLALSSNLKRHRAHRFYRSLGFRKHGYSFQVNL